MKQEWLVRCIEGFSMLLLSMSALPQSQPAPPFKGTHVSWTSQGLYRRAQNDGASIVWVGKGKSFQISSRYFFLCLLVRL